MTAPLRLAHPGRPLPVPSIRTAPIACRSCGRTFTPTVVGERIREAMRAQWLHLHVVDEGNLGAAGGEHAGWACPEHVGWWIGSRR